MPLLISTKLVTTMMSQAGSVTQPLRYRVRGDKVLWRWWWMDKLGMLIHFREDTPEGADIFIARREVAVYIPVSRESVDADLKKRAEAQAQQHAGKGAEKRIIETPEMMIPRKRAH